MFSLSGRGAWLWLHRLDLAQFHRPPKHHLLPVIKVFNKSSANEHCIMYRQTS